MTNRRVGLASLKGRVVPAVAEHLLKVVVVVYKLIVNDLAVLLYRHDFRIQESSVWLESERGITVEELAEKTGIGYARTAELTGILELDSLITIDLLQRCSINPRNI